MFQIRLSLYIFFITAFNPACKHIFHHSSVAMDPN